MTAVPFETYVAEHFGALQRFAQRLTREDAEDLVNEAVERGLQEPEVREPGPWLRTAIRIRWRMRQRGDRRRRARETAAAPRTEGATKAADVLHELSVVEALLAELRALDEPYRSVVTARFLSGCSPQEIAAEHDVPVGRVRWQVHEGLARLRKALDRRFGERRQWLPALVAFGGIEHMGTPATEVLAGGLVMNGKLIVVSGAVVGLGLWLGTTTQGAEDLRNAPPEPAAGARALPDRNVSDERSADAPASAMNAGASMPAANASLSEEPSKEPSEEPSEQELAAARELKRFVSRDVGRMLNGCIDAYLEPGDRTEGLLQLALRVEPQDFARSRLVNVEATRERLHPEVDFDSERFAGLSECVVEKLAALSYPSLGYDDSVSIRFPLRYSTRRYDPFEDPRPEFGSEEWDAWDERNPLLPIPGDDVNPEASLPDPRDALPTPAEAVTQLQLPIEGQSDAPVTVVVCGHYDCGPCRVASEHLEARIANGDIALAWLNNPSGRSRSSSMVASSASIAAGLQGRHAEFHSLLYDHPEARDEAALVELARSAGLDPQRFAADMADPATLQRIADEREICRAAGAHAVPSFLVDGDLVSGVSAEPLAALDALIDDARDRAE